MNRPTICVTLTARTAPGTRTAIEAARSDGGDVAEVRFDRWSDEERGRAEELFPSPLPLLATYRSVAEGGEGSVDPEARAGVLRGLRRLPFRWVDRERARDEPPARSEFARSIASRHLSAPVDWAAFRDLAVAGHREGELAKIVAPATVGEFLGPMRSALGPGEDPPDAVLATGPAGALSRVWPAWLGTGWVFASPGPSDPSPEASVEPSQPPVDRVRSVLRREPPGPLFAVIGHPIAYSESPRLHHGWLRAERADGAYIALDVETEREFRDLLAQAGPRGFRGLNVTHPWKGLARAVAQRVEPAAEEADAVNCLTWDGAGWSGALTDVDAVERRLGDLVRAGSWGGRELTILGGGAAARATVIAARRLGASARVRTRDPSDEAVLQRRFPETVHGAARTPAPLVVHATPVGRAEAGPLGFPVEDLLQRGSYVLDFVYGSEISPLPRLCAAVGATYEDGRRLLVYQAEESYRRWWGHAPPTGAPSSP